MENTTLYMLTETSRFMMSFVLVTKNDNVIVIDGGRPLDMPLLKQYIAGRHISAWILTHAHNDHISGFVDEMEFDRLGVFAYSREEDTPAASMPDQVDDEQKEIWRDELMELQQEVSLDRTADKVGAVVEAIVEGKVADENVYVGRTYMDAPGVDGYVFIYTDEELMSGQFVDVRITGASEYDLIGELTDESAQ